MRSRLTTFLVLLILGATTTVAHADDFTFNGSFAQDDDVRYFSFTLTGTAQVTLQTTSYAAGGFDPVLTLFSNDFALIDFNDDGPNLLDAELITTLDPGLYYVSLTQADNFAIGPNIRDGFTRAGEGNFTAQNGGVGATGPFIDGFGNQRNSNYSFTALNVSTATEVSAAVFAPEPASLTLLVVGFGSFLVRRRTHKIAA